MTSLVAGYYSVRTQGITYRMHRVVYELVHGSCPALIDHKDLDRSNNHPDNLRPATVAANVWNCPARVDSVSGVKGVWYDHKREAWVASITANKQKYRKRSSDRAVVEAWLAAKRLELHGEFAHTG